MLDANSFRLSAAGAVRLVFGYDNGHFHNLSILLHVGHCGTIGDRGTREEALRNGIGDLGRRATG